MAADPMEELVENLREAAGPFWPGAWETDRGKEYSRWNKVIPDASFSALEFYAAVEESIARKRLPEVEMGRVTWKERGLFSSRREYLRIERNRYVYDICAAPFGKDFFFSSWLVILPRAFTLMQFLGMISTATMFGLLARYQGIPGIAGAAGIFLLACAMIKFRLLAGLAPSRIGIEDFVSGMTIFGAIYDRYLRPLSYFEQDTASMFEKSVHGAMMEIIDGLAEAKGLQPLTEDERKPEYFRTPLWVSFFRK